MTSTPKKIALAFALSGLVTLAAWAGGRAAPNPVQVTAAVAKARGEEVVNITFTIQKPWHIYANPVKNEAMEPSKTVIQVTAKGEPATAQVQYPAGETLSDKDFGKFNVYEGRVTIPVLVRRPPGEAGPLEVTVTYSACNANSCLPSKTVKLSVP